MKNIKLTNLDSISINLLMSAVIRRANDEEAARLKGKNQADKDKAFYNERKLESILDQITKQA